jgi:hypothetical protein
MDEVQIIACVPCLDGIQLGYKTYEGSVIKECSQCQLKVWVGPESMKRMNEGVPIVCMRCILKEHGPDALKNMRPLTDK